MLEKLEFTQKHLTSQVAASELDDIMMLKTERTEREDEEVQNMAMLSKSYVIGPPAQNTFKKNRLSVDPMVFPSSKLEAMAKIQMKTLDNQMSPNLHSLKSPRK